MFVPLTDPPEDLDAPALFFCVGAGDVLLVESDAGPVLPCGTHPEAVGLAGGERHFLGLLDGQPCWSVDVTGVAPPDRGVPVPLRSLYGQVPDEVWTVAGRAVQIVEWDRTHRFCGRCGTATVAEPGERAKRCPSCGLLAFPRLAPAVIVLVERDGELLLARNAMFPVGMYSALAGFVEPGETLEQAVCREVKEEVGVDVDDVTYFGSQPWPFPHSLMIGFTARWAGGDIRVDEREIVDAAWFRPDALPMVPPAMSIARRLIDAHLARVLPR